jgi:formate dehydrogenase major subunit
MSENTFTLNGRTVSFIPGQTILEAAENHGVRIPALCHLKGTKPTGSCGICVVEAEGKKDLIPACSTVADRGMKIFTESSRVIAARKAVLKDMLASGNHNCAIAAPANWTEFQLRVQENDGAAELCPVWGDCKLQDLAFHYQVTIDRAELPKKAFPIEMASPMIVRDFSRCIRCGRCVKACNEVQVNRAITLETDPSPESRPSISSDCVFCGECVQACPVGALVEKKARYIFRPHETEKIRTTCPYCGVGCQQMLHVKDGKIVKVTGAEGAEPNQGRLCVKGRFGYDFIYSEDRLKTPLIRENGGFREASWDESLDLVANKIKQVIAESGADAIAGVSCARSINEDSYQMQKLFRAVIGTNNIDHCART